MGLKGKAKEILGLMRAKIFGVTAGQPTQKPVALLEYLIKTYTKEGEVVMDNCMGSGSAGIACGNTGRQFIGIEADDYYFQTAKARYGQKDYQVF